MGRKTLQNWLCNDLCAGKLIFPLISQKSTHFQNCLRCEKVMAGRWLQGWASMNIGTHFDCNNHIMFISTKIGTHPLPCKRNWICWFGNIHVVANFHQCLSLIVNKLSTWDTNQNLGKASWYLGSSKNLSRIQALYISGLGLTDQLLIVSLVVEKL